MRRKRIGSAEAAARRFVRAFSLVELLVVMGIMATLGTVSVAGYFAATRGMKVRGSVQDTISFMRRAYQTCQIEQTPVAVLFMNRTLADGSTHGVAIAVKSAGRLSLVAGGGIRAGANGAARGGTTGQLLVDEFADWDVSNPVVSIQGSDSEQLRLFNMRNIESTAKQGLRGCSSLMENCVAYVRMNSLHGKDWLPNAGVFTDVFCQTYAKEAQHNLNATSGSYANGNDFRWGYPFHPKNDGLPPSGWKVGDAYGKQSDEFELPQGFIFGNSVPSGQAGTYEPASGTAAVVFRPSRATGTSQSFSAVIVSEVAEDGSGASLAGQVKASDLKDLN